MYNFNWSYIIYILTPSNWRDVVTQSWLSVLVSQVKSLHTTFLSWKATTDQTLQHNGQVIYLTKLLNDKFDNINRGIYIDTISDDLYTYLFNEAEQQPVYFYNNYDIANAYSSGEFAQTATGIYLATSGSTGRQPESNPTYWSFQQAPTFLFNVAEIISQFDFIVFIPVAVVFNPLDVQAVVNYYKIAGKRYTIQTY